MADGIPSATGSTSVSLLQRAQQHDESAWRRLTAVYTPLVYEWCRSTGLQVNDAADVSQEVFRSVATGLKGFRRDRPGDSFRGWLWTITRNKVRDHFRDAGRRPDAPGGSDALQRLQQLADEIPADDDFCGGRIRSNLARRAISLMQSDFEELTWRAFWMTAVDQQPPQSVAEQLGLSAGAVYQYKSRVLRRLREELDGLDLID